MGHKKVHSTTARYVHIPDRALISAADQISAGILAALDGKKEAANILSIQQRR